MLRQFYYQIGTHLTTRQNFFFPMLKSYLKICPVISESSLGYFHVYINKGDCEHFQNLRRLCTFSEVCFFRYGPSLRSLCHSKKLDFFFIAFVPCVSGGITRVSIVLFPNFT